MSADKPDPTLPPGFETNKEARQWAMLAHLSGALLGFIGPLVIWLIKKDDYPFVDDQGKEALNFGITLLIGYAIAGVITMVTCWLGFPVLFIPAVVQLVFGIIGCVKANEGAYYRYPVCLRLL